MSPKNFSEKFFPYERSNDTGLGIEVVWMQGEDKEEEIEDVEDSQDMEDEDMENIPPGLYSSTPCYVFWESGDYGRK